MDCKTENFGGTDPLPGVQKVCKTEGPDAPPPPLSGDQIIKTRSGNQVMDYSSGTLKLWTSVAGEGNQLFAWEPHQRGDMVLRSTKYNVCIEFPDSRSQGMKVVFTGCNKDEPKQQMIYDNGSYLGQDNGVPEWNIRPRKDSNWCLSTKDGTFDQGDEIVWQEGSCDGAERRWNYRGLTPPPPPSPPSWSVNPTSVTLPSGIVGGAITSGVFTITNAGGAGNFTVTSSNPYFTLSTASGSLSAGSSANVNVSAGACPSAGTQSGTVTVLGGGSSATVNISRVCAGAAVWTVNPASLTFTDAVGGGAPLGTSFLLQNSGSGAGSYAITANQAWVRFNRSSGTLNPGGSDTVGVEVDDCTTTGSQTAQILVSGGASAVVSVSRVCNAAPNPPPPPAPTPSVPSKVQIAMTSGGKMFVTWPEVSGTTAYEFAGTFDGQAVSISGQIPAQANATAGAIAQFMTAPDAADKQGKSICLSVRAVNGSGSSAYSSLGCAPYRYYTLSTLSVTAQDAYPRITVNR